MNEEILKIHYGMVKYNWDLLQRYLEFKGNPMYILVGNVNLRNRKDIFDLGNLVGIEGDLFLGNSSIESLGELEFVRDDFWLDDCKNIKTLGKLKKVGIDLWLDHSPIESLGELKFVGNKLLIYNTKIHQSELNKVEFIGKILK